MGSLVEFVLGKDAYGKETEQTEQQRQSSEADWEERWAVCRSRGAQLWEEPGARDFSPKVCWKDLGNANKESFSH